MARPHERVFALVGALLFLGTSVAVSGVVIWQAHQQSQADKAVKKASDDLNKTIQDKSNNQSSTQSQEGQLQGTKLADFTPVDHVDKLQIIDTTVGTGQEVKAGDTITAHYTGAVAATGVIFQSSHDGQNQPIQFSLDQVIKGWTDGVPGMKVGGKRRLIIPAAEAYGANPPAGSGIPANADLVFDIELTSIP